MTVATSPVIRSSRGLRYHFAPEDTFIPARLAASGEWEEDVAGIIDVELRPGWTFLDIGAGVGYFTCIAARRGNHVIAIEPAATAVRLLEANLLENDVRAEVRSCAVSDTTGVGHISVDPDEYPGNLGALHLTDEGESVRLERLADILGARRPEMIKIDIEGMEGRVLRDSVEIVDAARVIVFEVSIGQMARYGDTVEATIGFLQSRGFEVKHSSGHLFTEAVMSLLSKSPYGYMNLVARK